MFNRVAISAEYDALCGLLLDCLHAGATRDEVSNIGFFIPVVVMEVECPWIVKTAAGTAQGLFPLHKNSADYETPLVDAFAVAATTYVAMVSLAVFDPSSGKVLNVVCL